MDSFNGTWTDQDGNTITIQENNNIITSRNYSNGRGPFQGYELDLGSPVITVDFSDGVTPDAGLQSGVLLFDNITIVWSNDTRWTRK